MKKLFTLFTLLSGVAVQAQNLSIDAVGSKMLQKPKYTNVSLNKPFTAASASRSNTTVFSLDYGNIDSYYGGQNGYNSYYSPWDVNSRYTNDDWLTTRYATVLFDTLALAYYDQSGIIGTGFIPTASATLTLDSFDLPVIYARATGSVAVDTFKITVYNTNTLSVTGSGANAVLAQTSVWDTTLVLSAGLPTGAIGGIPDASLLSFQPNIPAFPQGETFGIRVDFVGDTANKFQYLATYNAVCSAEDGGAVESVIPDNSLYYINAKASPTSNFSGLNSVGFNTTVPENCRAFWLQNIWLIPYVTAQVDYGVKISSPKTNACPGEVVPLTINLFGTDETNVTIAWATNSGNLDNSDGEENAITLGSSNATVTLAVTTADGTVYDTLVILAKPTTVTFNTNPYSINCGTGQTVQLVPVVTPSTGVTYQWSGGNTPTTKNNTVTAPGTYTITATNSFGCSASASVSVQYTGGVTNDVNFTKPNGNQPLCVNEEYTFVNTSSNIDGWNAYWEYGDGNTTDDIIDGRNTYTTTGNNKVVKLTMTDANGCSFSKTQTVNVQICTGINDPAFENTISVLPNPTNANVTIEVMDVNGAIGVDFFNILGAKVKTFSSNVNGAFTKTFNISELASGTYIVKIASGNKIATKRLIVNK